MQRVQQLQCSTWVRVGYMQWPLVFVFATTHDFQHMIIMFNNFPAQVALNTAIMPKLMILSSKGPGSRP